MVDGSGVALWFGASGFEVLEVIDDAPELVVEVGSTATVVGCARCGTRASAKDRRWVTVRDAPAGDRPVLVRWHKRIWACPEPDCDAKTWTERAELAAPRRVLTERAEQWATNRVAALEGPGIDRERVRGVVVHGVERRGPSRRDGRRGPRPGATTDAGGLR